MLPQLNSSSLSMKNLFTLQSMFGALKQAPSRVPWPIFSPVSFSSVSPTAVLTRIIVSLFILKISLYNFPLMPHLQMALIPSLKDSLLKNLAMSQSFTRTCRSNFKYKAMMLLSVNKCSWARCPIFVPIQKFRHVFSDYFFRFRHNGVSKNFRNIYFCVDVSLILKFISLTFSLVQLNDNSFSPLLRFFFCVPDKTKQIV